jgi:hypothetical protein
MTESYQKHKYEINIVECAQNVIRKLSASKVTINMKISIDEYAERLKMAVKGYNWSIGLSKDASKTQKMNAQVISTNHPAFDFWLALHLTIMEPHEIPLLLDAYHRNDFETLDNFIGHVEFFSLKIIHFNVFYPCDEHKKEIVQWVREIRKIHTQQVNQINIGELHINLVTNIERIDVLFDQRSIINNFNATNIFYSTQSQSHSTSRNDNEINDSSQESIVNTKLIDTQLSYEEVMDYFLQLFKLKKNDSKSYLSKEDVCYLVKSNFKFKNIEAVNPKKCFTIKISKQNLRFFIHTFYKEIDQNKFDGKAERYCQFLIDNFSIFKTNDLQSLKKNFARPTTGYYPFK